MTIALCLAILCLAAIAAFALWTMWGTIKVLRHALYDSGQRQDAAQARILALSMDARGSVPLASQALDHARPSAQVPDHWPGQAVPMAPSYDDVTGLAGG